MTDNPGDGGRDHGRDAARDLGDEPLPAYRDAAPDMLGPIDAAAPVSGHMANLEAGGAVASLTAEHDWSAAVRNLFPILRPVGTTGLRLDEVDRATLVANANRAHTMPLLGDGPCGLVVVYALPATGFDVLVNGEHLLSWGVEPGAIHDAALRNLAAWSADAGWSNEASGYRRLLSSDTGAGMDAARILLPEARALLARELGGAGAARVLVGLPDRHLLMAGAMLPGDDEFANLFHNYVIEHSEGADEPIDRRVFELVGAELVDFAG
jgi:hypothetical protein